MREGIAYLSFTDRGAALAETLRAKLGGETARCGSPVSLPGETVGPSPSGETVSLSGQTASPSGETVSLSGWTAAAFSTKRALVYVGAVGIAVRAIAPHIQDKSRDPAVLAVDEQGRYAVPLLSGHLGGANDLARAIAALTGGTAVITTATDLRGVFAVDDWARRQDCAVVNPANIKRVSAALLAGKAVRVRSTFPIAGTPPEGVRPVEGILLAGDISSGIPPGTGDPDIWVDIYRPTDAAEREGKTLYIAPRVLVLGVGCKRGTGADTLEAQFLSLCRETGLWPEAFCAAATLDRKAAEPGLLSFCVRRDWPLYSFSAEELRLVPGLFTESAFVAETVGVGNVCERAAVLGAAEPENHSPGTLLVRKRAGQGVTMAVAQRPFRLDWGNGIEEV